MDEEQRTRYVAVKYKDADNVEYGQFFELGRHHKKLVRDMKSRQGEHFLVCYEGTSLTDAKASIQGVSNLDQLADGDYVKVLEEILGQKVIFESEPITIDDLRQDLGKILRKNNNV